MCYGNVGAWLGGWVFVTRRYCIKMAKPILKLFDSLVAASFKFLLTPAPKPNSNGTPSAGR